MRCYGGSCSSLAWLVELLATKGCDDSLLFGGIQFSFEISCLSQILDFIADAIVIIHMSKTLGGWLRKTSKQFALKLFVHKFGYDLFFGGNVNSLCSAQKQ